MSKPDFMVIASGNYLTEHLPTNWQDDDFDEDEFVENNLWEPFENETVGNMWFHISQAADELERMWLVGYKQGHADGESQHE